MCLNFRPPEAAGKPAGLSLNGIEGMIIRNYCENVKYIDKIK
jgi:hypothetical protein